VLPRKYTGKELKPQKDSQRIVLNLYYEKEWFNGIQFTLKGLGIFRKTGQNQDSISGSLNQSHHQSIALQLMVPPSTGSLSPVTINDWLLSSVPKIGLPQVKDDKSDDVQPEPVRPTIH